MELNPKISVFLVFFLLIVFSGCTQISPSISKTVQVNIREKTPVPLSDQQIITTPGYYQLVNDVAPLEVSRDSGGACVYFKIRSSDVVIDGMGHVMEGGKINHPCSYRYAFLLKDKGGSESRYVNVIIRNVTVSNWTSGVLLYGAHNFLVENTEMKNNSLAAVQMSGSSNIIIKNNVFSKNKDGINTIDSEKTLISDNLLSNSSYHGIQIEGIMMTKAPIEKNFFGQQIRFYPDFWYTEQRTSGGRYLISRNAITNNTMYGIGISDSAYNVIEENLIADNGQGILGGMDNNVIQNNTIINNRGYGIWSLDRGINQVFENNTFSGNKDTLRKTYSTWTNVPATPLFGILLIFLLNVFIGTSNVTSKIITSRLMKSSTSGMVEEKISTAVNRLKILSFLNSNMAVSLVGAVILGIVFTILNQLTFGLTADVLLIFSIIGGIVVVTPKVVQYSIARKIGMQAAYRIWWGGIFVMIVTLLLSLGQVFGQPVQTGIEHERVYEKKYIALFMVIGPLMNLILSAAFLTMYFVMQGTYASLAWTGLTMSLLTAFVSIIPICPMEGVRIFKWNKLAWLALFVPILLAYSYFMILH
jgi:parallel beta-helix repeat protein